MDVVVGHQSCTVKTRWSPVSQNRRKGTFLGLGRPPHKVVFFKDFLGLHRGTGVLTHCQIIIVNLRPQVVITPCPPTTPSMVIPLSLSDTFQKSLNSPLAPTVALFFIFCGSKMDTKKKLLGAGKMNKTGGLWGFFRVFFFLTSGLFPRSCDLPRQLTLQHWLRFGTISVHIPKDLQKLNASAAAAGLVRLPKIAAKTPSPPRHRWFLELPTIAFARSQIAGTTMPTVRSKIVKICGGWIVWKSLI